MGQRKRIRRGAAGWRKLVSKQTSSGLGVSEFCRREGINASLFSRWRSMLKGSSGDAQAAMSMDRAVESAAPFIDLGEICAGGPRFEVRLDLGAGMVLSIARS